MKTSIIHSERMMTFEERITSIAYTIKQAVEHVRREGLMFSDAAMFKLCNRSQWQVDQSSPLATDEFRLDVIKIGNGQRGVWLVSRESIERLCVVLRAKRDAVSTAEFVEEFMGERGDGMDRPGEHSHKE